MAGNISDQTTNFTNIAVSGVITGGTISPSQVSGPLLSGISLNVISGVQASGVTLDLRTNAVIPSVVTYPGGASISGLTIGQWGFVQNASGFSIAFSSGKTAYFFGGSTLSAAIT